MANSLLRVVRRVVGWYVAAVVSAAVAVVWAPPAALHAQTVRGTVKAAGTDSVIDGALVSLIDSVGIIFAESRTNAAGRFQMDAQRAGVVQFLVRKVGLEPTASEQVQLPADVDTVDVVLSAPVSGVTLATVLVLADRDPPPNFNTRQLADARQYGWRIIQPHRIAEARATAQTLGDLIRRNPLPGVSPPDGATGCFFSSRSNRCLTIVVDGQVLGPGAFVAPNDVYFIALLTPSQSTFQYGPRAPDGALFVATRRRNDNERPPRN